MAGGPEEVTQIITHKRRAFQYFSKHSTDFGINPFFSLPKTPNTYTITTTQCRNAIKKFANRTAARRFPHDICHAHSVLSASNIQKKKKPQTSQKRKHAIRYPYIAHAMCLTAFSRVAGCRAIRRRTGWEFVFVCMPGQRTHTQTHSECNYNSKLFLPCAPETAPHLFTC